MSLKEPLDKVESRVFGVLVEKEFTTPDGYPLSLNALVNGCNQKSNRHPVMSFDEQTVTEAILRLRLHRLVSEVHSAGARVVKYAHAGREVLEVDNPALAVLVELLLRGPQSAGELRTRASRMAALADLPALDAVLQPLVQREMVRQLPPAPGSRAQRWMQLLSPDLHPVDATPLAAMPAAPAPTSAPRPAAAPSPTTAGPHAVDGADLTALTRRIEALENQVRRLTERGEGPPSATL